MILKARCYHCHITNNSSGNWPRECKYRSDPRVTTRHHDGTGVRARAGENEASKYRCPSNASFEAVKHGVEWNTAETGVVSYNPNVLFTSFPRSPRGPRWLSLVYIFNFVESFCVINGGRTYGFPRLPTSIPTRIVSWKIAGDAGTHTSTRNTH